MKIRRFYALAALAGAALLTMGSLAVAAKLAGPPNPPNTKSFHASLNGYHETPSISTPAFGEFDAKLVDPATLHFVFTFSGLKGGNTLFAHVHFGQVGFGGRGTRSSSAAAAGSRRARTARAPSSVTSPQPT